MRSGSQIKKTASRSRAYLRATYDLLSEKIMVGSFCFTKESVKLGNSSKKHMLSQDYPIPKPAELSLYKI